VFDHPRLRRLHEGSVAFLSFLVRQSPYERGASATVVEAPHERGTSGRPESAFHNTSLTVIVLDIVSTVAI
jgi:hypothetical protein